MLRKFHIHEIHNRINDRQTILILAYYESIFTISRSLHKKAHKVIPKNMRYGGHRNTCYDFRWD